MLKKKLIFNIFLFLESAMGISTTSETDKHNKYVKAAERCY